MNNQSESGTFLREYIKARILKSYPSITSFAKAIGKNQGKVSMFLNGKTDPTLETLFLYLRHLDLNIGMIEKDRYWAKRDEIIETGQQGKYLM